METKDNIDRIIIYILSIFLFLVPLVYFHELRDASSLPRYALLGLVSGVFVLLTSITINNKKRINYSSIMILIILFFSYASLSLLWSSDPGNTKIQLVQLLSLIILCYAFMNFSAINSSSFFPIIASLTGATLAAVIGIAQYFNFNPFSYHQFMVPASTFTNTNFASLYLDLILPVSFAFIFIAKNSLQRLLASLSSGLCFSFILISHTRGSWLGLVIALIIFLYLLFKNKNIRIILSDNLTTKIPYILLSLIIALSLFSISPPTIEQPRKHSQLAIDGSSKIRLNAYINSLSIIKDHPLLGTGYGAFRSSFRNYMFATVPFTTITEDNTLLYLHNDPLQLFVELGITGGILYILIYLLVLKRCWFIFSYNKDSRLILITLGIFISLIASGVHSLVDFPLHKPSSAIMLWCWFGFILGTSTTKTGIKSLSIKKKYISIVSVITLLSGITYLSYITQFYSNYLSASKYRLSSEIAHKNNDCKTALINTEKMIELFDYDFRHLARYVNVYSSCPSDYETKLNAMKKVLAKDPTNTRALITQGTIYLNTHKLTKAKANFMEITRLLPHKASGYIGLAYSEYLSGNSMEAELLSSYAVLLEPDNKIAVNLFNKMSNL